jgi:CheY-like chemotaxis protein
LVAAMPRPEIPHPVDIAMQQLSSGKAVILTIDDEPAVLAELAQALRGTNYTCHACSDPAAAAEMAREVLPDLIISDINIGGHSGLELCEQLKQEPGLTQVPVMFLSGAQIPDVIRRAHAAGGTYYLRKPFDPQVLLELVEKALWMPHLIREHVGA